MTQEQLVGHDPLPGPGDEEEEEKAEIPEVKSYSELGQIGKEHVLKMLVELQVLIAQEKPGDEQWRKRISKILSVISLSWLEAITGKDKPVTKKPEFKYETINLPEALKKRAQFGAN
jgi:hypothetical protein